MPKGEKNNTQNSISKREEEILALWKERKIFEKSLEKPAPLGEFVFYDGPPFATGLPHYGHVLAGTLKDVIPRYQTMRGKRVRRRWGWDCHGLPLENLIEAELGLKTKKDVEEIGIGKFNEAARKAVLRYRDEWKRIIPRLGRWADMENDYRTMDASYMETIWWMFKTLYDRGLIYEGRKVMYLCPRCGTTLANFEVSQGYKDIQDIAATVKFELTDEPGTYLLAWTTTPWTLPGNVALAVNPKFKYLSFAHNGKRYVVAKERAGTFFDRDQPGYAQPRHMKEFDGKELVGKKYRPVFSYNDKVSLEERERIWRVYAGEFVSQEEGTGIVHIAPAFGEDDMKLATSHGLPIIEHVKTDGTFKDGVHNFSGLPVKPKGRHQETDKKIVEYLKVNGTLFKEETITHSYPHCWRCETPLINFAASSWFVKVIALKKKLIRENKKIEWVPGHLKEGRFGKWLEGARDWAISRSRYWGAPIPVWKCEKCSNVRVVGSFKEFRKDQERNTYTIMRHAEAESNTRNTVSDDVTDTNSLTERGREQAREAGRKLREKTGKTKIDLIYASDFARTRETAEIVAAELGLGQESIRYDARLRELATGGFHGKTWTEYMENFASRLERFTKVLPGGETVQDVKHRAMHFLHEVDKSEEGKNILIVSHGIVLLALFSGSHGLSQEETVHLKHWGNFLGKAETHDIIFSSLPYNDRYEIDVHRPQIDDITFSCESCNGVMRRVPEVFDCWFESGAMPYASHHYPFERSGDFHPRRWFGSRGFPADFIAEALDQTRGWFYSMLVLGVALFGRTPFRAVLVNGILLGEDGQKLSKRLKNYPDPMEVVERYGADALRLYLLGSSAMRGEDVVFSEAGVAEVMRRVLTRLDNVASFYELYAKEGRKNTVTSGENILDRWIMSRLSELVALVTRALDEYELAKGVQAIDLFVDDLSTWYVRRSRDRFRGDDTKDKEVALQTLGTSLTTLSKVMAPFAPFIAEMIYQRVTKGKDKESVHLSEWPIFGRFDSNILVEMKRARDVVKLGLLEREKAGIKVRQPLQKISTSSVFSDKVASLIGDELNVDEVIYDRTQGGVLLDTKITPDLKDRGHLRELIRHIQGLRKEKGFSVSDRPKLIIHANKLAQSFIESRLEEVKKGSGLASLHFERQQAEESEEKIQDGELEYSLSLER